MGYIPEDAEWFVAEIILEINVENDHRNVVHLNTVLIQANSPEEAYQKATQLGEEENDTYKNTDGKTVKTRFRGLGQLNVLLDELEHGAEIMYDEYVGVSEEKIKSWTTPKDKLGVFAPREKRKDTPNYLAKSVEDELKKMGCSPEDWE